MLSFINKALFSRYRALINRIYYGSGIRFRWKSFYSLRNLFSIKVVNLLGSLTELLKLININNYAINLIEKTLKIYIEINLINASIRPFKSIVRAPIFIFLEVINFGSPGPYQTYFIQLDLINAYHWRNTYESNNLKIVF